MNGSKGSTQEAGSGKPVSNSLVIIIISISRFIKACYPLGPPVLKLLPRGGGGDRERAAPPPYEVQRQWKSEKCLDDF